MFKRFLKIINNDVFFFSLLFLFVLFLFKNAFSVQFFQDDFFFLKISNAKSFSDFVNFFLPIRTYSYKPLATEVFYFFLISIGKNIFIGHLVVFVVFFVGLYYLKKTIMLITGNNLLSKLTVFLYAISFIHVFQLFWFATFQEVVVLTCLILSFYCYQKNKMFLSALFFLAALLSKETAILFTVFLVGFELIFRKKTFIKKLPFLLMNILMAAVFLLVYKYSLSNVTSLDNYKFQFNNPKLILNNLMWYFLWSLGFPNFMSDVFKSFPFQPLPDFWKAFTSFEFKIYFYSLITYFLIFFIFLAIFVKKNNIKIIKILKACFYSLIGFFIFLGPILFFSHKWMVRLTLPLVFIVLLQAYLVFLFLSSKEKLFRLFAYMIIALFIFWNFFGIKVHESSSVYNLENKISKNADVYFNLHINEILKHKYLFFYDLYWKNKLYNPWGGSEKLKNTFWDQYFIHYYFPNSNITALYNFENKIIPPDSFIATSSEILLFKK
jgi:hypothetical protein